MFALSSYSTNSSSIFFCSKLALQAVLNLLLPLRRLLSTLSTETVGPCARVKVEEAVTFSLLWSSMWNTGRLRDPLHLTEVDRPLAVEVLPGVVVPQLMLDGVQHKPSLFPSFQQSTTLVQIALASNIRMFILVCGTELIPNTVLLAKLSACSTLGVELVQVVRGGVPRHGLVLGAGLGHVVPALLMAVQAAILTSKPSPHNSPEDRVAQVAVGWCCVVVLLKPVRVGVGPSPTSLRRPTACRSHLATQ